MMGDSKAWFVRLGQPEWLRFTYPRPEGDALRLLGSVRRGARVGALAVTATGEYVQVNGDHVSPLSGSQIRKALAKAEGAAARSPAPRSKPTAPVIVVKRRRVLSKQ